MGQSAAQTVREIEQTRARLETNLGALQDRLPEREDLMRRAAGLAIGGLAGGAALWIAMRRLRSGRHAEGPAPETVTVVRTGRWSSWIAVASFALNAIAIARLRRMTSASASLR
jgi:hypothetical protein